MANHAYVIPEVLPSQEYIFVDLFEIVNRKFPQFGFGFSITDQRWHLSYKGDGYIGIEFWLSDYEGQPCIEFRHGHGEHMFLWWVEHEIREELATRYRGKVVDDSEPDKHKDPSQERYDTYRDYVVRNRWADLDRIEGWKAYINERLDRERDALPDEIKHLIGENIP